MLDDYIEYRCDKCNQYTMNWHLEKTENGIKEKWCCSSCGFEEFRPSEESIEWLRKVIMQ